MKIKAKTAWALVAIETKKIECADYFCQHDCCCCEETRAEAIYESKSQVPWYNKDRFKLIKVKITPIK